MEFGIQNLAICDQHVLMHTPGCVEQRSLIILAGRKDDQFETFGDRLSKRNTVIQFSADMIKNPHDLIQSIITHSNVSLIGKSSHLENKLQEIYSHLKARRKKLLLLFKNAEQLPVAVLATLSYLAYFQENRATCIRVLLQGNNKLSKKLQIFYGKEVPVLSLKEIHQSLEDEANIENHEISSPESTPCLVKDRAAILLKSSWLRGVSLGVLIVAGLFFQFHRNHVATDHPLIAQPQQLTHHQS